MVLALVAAAVVGAQPPAEAAQPIPAATTALVTTFADGRSTSQLVSAKAGWMWTPITNLPRVSDWTLAPGSLPPAALKISRVLDGDRVRVTISMLLGTAHEQEADVSSFVLTRGDHVVVDGVRAYGLQPIELSLAAVENEPLYRPRVTSITPDFEIDDIELFSAPYPGYRVTVRNVGARAAANFRVLTHMNGRAGSTFVARGTDARPVLPPGGTTTFKISLVGGSPRADGSRTPAPLDDIEIASVFWDDGTFTGEPYAAAENIVADAGRRYQLTRVLAILSRAAATAATSDDLAAIRTEIAALPDGDRTRLAGAQHGMAEMKETVLRDIADFEGRRVDGGMPSLREFLRETVARYEKILARLAPG